MYQESLLTNIIIDFSIKSQSDDEIDQCLITLSVIDTLKNECLATILTYNSKTNSF